MLPDEIPLNSFSETLFDRPATPVRHARRRVNIRKMIRLTMLSVVLLNSVVRECLAASVRRFLNVCPRTYVVSALISGGYK